MSADTPRALAHLGPLVRSDLEQLARATVAKIVEVSEFYRDSQRLSREELVVAVQRNIEYLLDHEPVSDTGDPGAQPRLTGREHALRGIPLASREALGVVSLAAPDVAPAVTCLEEHALGGVGVSPLLSSSTKSHTSATT